MVALTTPARRAISAMLASGSLASASTAASRIRATLRSASARRRGGLDAERWRVGGIVRSVGADGPCEAELREEAPGGGEDRKREHARDARDRRGDEEGVADAARQRGGRAGAGCGRNSAGGDRGEDGDAE